MALILYAVENTNPFDAINTKLQNLEQLILCLRAELTQENQNEYLNIEQVSSILHVSEQSVYSYIKRGLLPAKKIGRPYFIKKSDLDNALMEAKSLKYRRN